jgi:NitT/TauT family transport system substrate-binding protein
MPTTETRRRLLTMAALAGGASLPPRRPACAAEPARETNTVRLGKITVICFAPQYVCESLLRAEGFTDIRYIDTTIATQQEELGSDKLDFHSNLPLSHVIAIDDECRSRSSPPCMPAATSCSPMAKSGASPT